ncbi:putative exported protein [Taylorella asinigenitalis 14/45]|uniref:Putative exported protein n=1 Tax=Taylorella asinigenitalis 14/45 TaxID=1091495 RepID=I7JMQ4_9BURK|nr:SPOR domain-containing protein [Taylorella asinigenitalis]CCG19714.1 putative exported protein [Taylorella asinigenitalis 14/45]
MARTKTKRVKNSRNSSSGFGWMIFGLALGLVFAAIATYFFNSKSIKTDGQKTATVQSETTKSTQASTTKPTVTKPTQASQDNTKSKQSEPTKKEESSDALGAMLALNKGQSEGALPQEKEASTAPESKSQDASTTQAVSTKPAEPVNKEASKTTETEVAADETEGAADETSQTEKDSSKVRVSEEQYSKPKAKTEPAKPAEPAFKKFIVTGRFLDKPDADRYRAQLLMRGLKGAKVISIKERGIKFYKVRVGPYTSKLDYDTARKRISQLP